MPSSASPSVLAELQAAGENLNTWGDTRLNAALSMLEAAGHGLTSHTLTADKSLTYTNFTATDGTDYVQKIAAASDGSYTLTLGGYERSYLIWNDSSHDQTIACSGGGDSVTVYASEVVEVYCDGTNVARLDVRRLFGLLNAGGFKIENLGAPTADADAATKKYIDDEILTASLGASVPARTNNGWALLGVSPDESGVEWNRTDHERITSNTTLSARQRPYFCDATGGSFTVTLPASPSARDRVSIVVRNGAGTVLTVDRNGETISGESENMTVPNIRAAFTLEYINSTWEFV